MLDGLVIDVADIILSLNEDQERLFGISFLDKHRYWDYTFADDLEVGMACKICRPYLNQKSPEWNKLGRAWASTKYTREFCNYV